MPIAIGKRASAISAGCGSFVSVRQPGRMDSTTISSSHGLKQAGVDLDRKVLADIAVQDPAAFTACAETAKSAPCAAVNPRNYRYGIYGMSSKTGSTSFEQSRSSLTANAASVARSPVSRGHPNPISLPQVRTSHHTTPEPAGYCQRTSAPEFGSVANAAQSRKLKLRLADTCRRRSPSAKRPQRFEREALDVTLARESPAHRTSPSADHRPQGDRRHLHLDGLHRRGRAGSRRAPTTISTR